MPDDAGRQRRLLVGVTVGGSAYSLLRGQLAWFRSQGWQVGLVSSPDVQAKGAAEREGVRLFGIPMHRGISPGKDLVSLFRWIRLVSRTRPDAINVGTPKASLLGIVTAWLCGVRRRVYTVRGLRLEGTGGAMERILWTMEWLTMKLASDVIFVSQSLADECFTRGLAPDGKAWLIGSGSSNGVDAAGIAARIDDVDRIALRTDLGFNDEDFVVGFIGRLVADKGIDTILRASVDPFLDRRIKWLLIGSTEGDDLEEALHKRDDRIHRIEWTDDLWGLLPALDILCLPTRREGFPNVVLEAGAAGIPAITTRATGAVDSVVQGVTGELFNVDSDVQIVDQLNRLVDDPELVKRMGEAARERAWIDFAPPRVWAGINEILTAAPEPANARRYVPNMKGRQE